MTTNRAEPVPTPETEQFWHGTNAGELRYQRCRDCALAYLPPQPNCPRCGSAALQVEVSLGRARVLSAVVSHLRAPGYPEPHVLAVVELDEGPHLLTNIVEVDASLAAVPIGLAVHVRFEPRGDYAVAVFAPEVAP